MGVWDQQTKDAFAVTGAVMETDGPWLLEGLEVWGPSLERQQQHSITWRGAAQGDEQGGGRQPEQKDSWGMVPPGSP